MLRNRQHSRRDSPPIAPLLWPACGDPRIEVLADLVDSLDLHAFLADPSYRRRLSAVLAWFSDEEFDSFEQLYTRRFTVN